MEGKTLFFGNPTRARANLYSLSEYATGDFSIWLAPAAYCGLTSPYGQQVCNIATANSTRPAEHRRTSRAERRATVKDSRRTTKLTSSLTRGEPLNLSLPPVAWAVCCSGWFGAFPAAPAQLCFVPVAEDGPE